MQYTSKIFHIVNIIWLNIFKLDKPQMIVRTHAHHEAHHEANLI